MFIARFNRREEGGYQCSYGKGSKALTAVMLKDATNQWYISSGLGFGNVPKSKKVKDVKAAWSAIAVAAYDQPKQSAPRVGPPSLRPLSVPPTPEAATEEAGRPGAADDGAPADCPPPGCMGDDTPEPEPTPKEKAAAEEAAFTGERCETCARPLNGWLGGKPPCRCGVVRTPEYRPDFMDPKMWERVEVPHAKSGMKEVDMYLTTLGALDQVWNWVELNREYCSTDGKLDTVWEDVRVALVHGLNYPEYGNS